MTKKGNIQEGRFYFFHSQFITDLNDFLFHIGFNSLFLMNYSFKEHQINFFYEILSHQSPTFYQKQKKFHGCHETQIGGRIQFQRYLPN